MNRLVIANTGIASQGKSTSVKEVFKLIDSRYPDNVSVIHSLESGDVKAIINVKGVLVGIESQGDPKSRIIDFLKDFLSAGCEMIVIACRTYGATYKAVKDMHQHGYQVIWTANDKNWDKGSIVDYLNARYAEHILQLIEDRLANKY